MRNFEPLSTIIDNAQIGIITFTSGGDASVASLALRREGEYVVIAASHGPLEIALRTRYAELVRTLKHIQPNDGLNTTRQVGTGQAFLALGRRTDGTLIVRPTIVGDASGFFCLNLALTPDSVTALAAWLGTDA